MLIFENYIPLKNDKKSIYIYMAKNGYHHRIRRIFLVRIESRNVRNNLLRGHLKKNTFCCCFFACFFESKCEEHFVLSVRMPATFFFVFLHPGELLNGSERVRKGLGTFFWVFATFGNPFLGFWNLWEPSSWFLRPGRGSLFGFGRRA